MKNIHLVDAYVCEFKVGEKGLSIVVPAESKAVATRSIEKYVTWLYPKSRFKMLKVTETVPVLLDEDNFIVSIMTREVPYGGRE